MSENEFERKEGRIDREAPSGCSGAFTESGGVNYGAATSHGSAIEVPDAEIQLVHTRDKKGGFVVYINSDTIGGRDTSHGRSLMLNFLFTLTEIAPLPKSIILVNSAVRLAWPGSAALENLSLMHEQGVQVFVAEKSIQEIEGGGDIAVGKAATMHTILHALLNAEKVVSP